MDGGDQQLNGLVKKVYEAILRTANRFLTHSRKYPIQFLQKENPSYQDVADLIDGARQLVHDAMHAFDPMLAQQAEEYCDLMIRMAAAIIEENQDKLEELCSLLERKPFAMPT